MRYLVIDNYSKHIAKLCALFGNADSICIEDFSLNRALQYYDAIVLSGGSQVHTVLRHPSNYQDQIDLIHTWGKPIIGVCLGAEIIVSAFGGELEEMEQKHSGEVVISVTDDTLRSAIGNDQIVVSESHRIRVKQLPDDFVLLAYSDHGIELFRHNSRPIIGFQFHPEISDQLHDLVWIESLIT